jgi:hypothetical protein
MRNVTVPNLSWLNDNNNDDDDDDDNNINHQAKVKVTLQPTISRPVRLGVRRPYGTSEQFFYLLYLGNYHRLDSLTM